jgi:VanZ family protein
LHAVLTLLDPLLRPAERTRWVCLLLLVTLVATMLFLGSRPGIEVVIPQPPWDKVAHLFTFGGYAALAWVSLKGASQVFPILVAGLISLMDEGMQYYSPGRSSDFSDILADLTGAKWLLDAGNRRRRLTP